MGLKTSGVGHFTIPTAPAAGVSVASGLSNVFTTTYVAITASTGAAIFITGLHVEKAAASAATYCVVQLATGGAGSETVVGQYLVALDTASTVALNYRPIFPPIAVANATRIAVKTADSVGSQTSLITLECINQSNVVDDGVAVGTVTTVTNQLTAAAIATGVWQDTTAGDFTTALSVGKSVMNGVTLGTGLTVASVSGAVGSVTGAVGSVTGAVGSVTAAITLPSIPANWITAAGITASALNGKGDWMVSYTQPTGFLAATFPTTVASTTNITSASGVSLAASQHVIVDSGTVTTLSNLPSIPANWITATGITASALNGKGDWPVGKTGYSLTTSDWAKAGDAMTLTVAYDAAKTALASSSYTAPDNTSITAIKTKTDSLTFTVANKLDGNIRAVNGITVNGSGTAGSPWGP